MRRMLLLMLMMGSLSLMVACDDGKPALAPKLSVPLTGKGSLAAMSCAASFRMITNDSDSLLAQYGIPSAVDTVDVCENWTGSDYTYQATLVGSSDNVPGFPDTIPTLVYQSGYLTGYDAASNTSSPPSPVGGTSFDFVTADAATRQASYDYPYYGVSSPDPTPSSCLQPPCPFFSISVDAHSSKNSAQVAPQSAHHGLHRRGFRALVDSAEELPGTPLGPRRFRSVRGNRTLVRSIDRKTELLVGEDDWSAEDSSHIVHTWKRVPNGYVRQRSDIESVDLIGGRRVHNHSRIEFTNVRIHDSMFVVDQPSP